MQITVELILEKLAAGESVEQLISAHPRLTAEGIRAAMAFATEALRADVVYPMGNDRRVNIVADENIGLQIVGGLVFR